MLEAININGTWRAQDSKGNIFKDELGDELDLVNEKFAKDWCVSRNEIDGYPAKEQLMAYKKREKKEQETKDFWESRRRTRELAEMDNQPMTDYDVHGSY